MHNLTKIKVFRILLILSYLPACVLVLPFALMRKRNPSGYFFFFDRYVIGGAQKVHIDILNAIPGIYKQVYFTRLSTNDKLKKEFYSIPDSDCKDIHTWCDNLLFRLFTVHYYAFYLNRHTKAIVFSSNSTFFYDMLFFISKKVKKTELLHNFTYGNNGMEFFGLANYRYLDHRAVVDAATRNNIIEQYKQYNIPETYADRIILIEPGVYVPDKSEKDLSLPLKVLYAGRGGPQKRIYLLNMVAEKVIKDKLPVVFHFAGTMMDELSEFVKQNSVIHGELSTQSEMYALYRSCHVLLMTSAYEGFPMLIKEGMANGCIPVVTALEGNKMHLYNNRNALLILNPEDEENVIKQGYAHLQWLTDNNRELQRLSDDCYSYAKEHFDKATFTAAYHTFLLNEAALR